MNYQRYKQVLGGGMSQVWGCAAGGKKEAPQR